MAEKDGSGVGDSSVLDDDAYLEQRSLPLGEPDAIMSPDVLDHLRDVIEAARTRALEAPSSDGQSDEAVSATATANAVKICLKRLTEGYEGFASMCNTLKTWLAVTGLSSEEVEQHAGKLAADLVLGMFDAKSADKALENRPDLAARARDVLLPSPKWRQLIYDLSGKLNGQSQFIDYLISKISDAGHSAELVVVPAASSLIEVYVKVLSQAIVKAMRVDQNSLENSCELEPWTDLVKLVSFSQQTYLYAMALLEQASRLPVPGAVRLRRLIQAIQAKVAVLAPSWSGLDMSFSATVDMQKDGGTSEDAGERLRDDLDACVAAISAIIGKNQLNPADVLVLHRVCCSKENGSIGTPTTPLLRNPRLLGLLVEDLFSPGGAGVLSGREDFSEKMITLLAHAVSVPYAEEIAEGTQVIGYDKTRASLRKLFASVTKLASSRITEDGLAVIKEGLYIPVFAKALLHFLERVTMSPSFFVSKNLSVTPLPFKLLDDVAGMHAGLRGEVLRIVSQLITVNYDGVDALRMMDVRKMVLDRAVWVLGCGLVDPVLSFVERGGMDPLLVAHFCSRVSEMVTGPFSSEFEAYMTRLRGH
eukprot:UC4_evm2s1476